MSDGYESVLTVANYSLDDNGVTYIKTRVTIAPNLVLFVIASDNFYSIGLSLELKKVNVVIDGGNNLELYISEVDLISIERAVGTYILP